MLSLEAKLVQVSGENKSLGEELEAKEAELLAKEEERLGASAASADLEATVSAMAQLVGAGRLRDQQQSDQLRQLESELAQPGGPWSIGSGPFSAFLEYE